MAGQGPSKPETLRTRVWSWRRFLLYPLALVVALLVLLEEWLWPACAKMLARLGLWTFWVRLEQRIARVPPGVAAMLFLIPALVILPIKIVGVWLIHRGDRLVGILTFVLGKVIGTAAAGRIYQLTESNLRKIAWLSRAIDAVLAFKDRIKRWALALPGIRLTLDLLHSIRQRPRSWWLRAVARLRRRQFDHDGAQ